MVTAGTPERDLSNAQFVGRRGDGLVTVGMPSPVMSREEALVHAAWLIVLAGGELEISAILAGIGGEQSAPAPGAVSVNDLPVTPGAAALYRLASRWWNEAFRLGRLLDQKHPRAVALEECSTTLRAAVNDLRRDGDL